MRSKPPAKVNGAAIAHGVHGTVILCDTSGSMSHSAGTRSRIVALREALAQVAKPEHRLMAFASEVTAMASPRDLPEPSGGTDLAAGLTAVAALNPAAAIVITDGIPQSERLSVAAAGRMTARIDVIFCGDPTDIDAIRFCGVLARVGRGRLIRHDWHQTPSLAAPIRRLLLEGGRP